MAEVARLHEEVCTVTRLQNDLQEGVWSRATRLQDKVSAAQTEASCMKYTLEEAQQHVQRVQDTLAEAHCADK